MRKFLFFVLAIFCSFSLHAHTEHSVTLTPRQLCDLELLMVGGYAPLKGFLGKRDYDSVVATMRLHKGPLWPIPIVFDISEELAGKCERGDILLLKDSDYTLLAKMQIRELWRPDKEKEAQEVYGTLDRSHPGVAYLFEQTQDFYVAGEIEELQKPRHYNFADLRLTPEVLKKRFRTLGEVPVVAFQTRNPMHRAHVAITKQAAESLGAHLLIQPVVGLTKPGDIDIHTRVRCYRQILSHYPEGSATLSVLPLAMRMAGPREALWHALIRKNYGATHFIVGRDHAGPGDAPNGTPFYPPFAARELAKRHATEMEIEIVPFPELVYVKEVGRYIAREQIEEGHTPLRISGTELRESLQENRPIPEWLSFPEIVAELKKAYPHPSEKGFCLLITGLSGAGKSTLANALNERLAELQPRSITLLDGDVIRTNLSKGLGYSKEDRSTNVRRVAYVASEAVRHKGAAICSMIAPYTEDRAHFRHLIEEYGEMVEIYLSTPLEVCEARDAKGLYKKVRAGLIHNFTGIDDPYEVPQAPHLTLDMGRLTVQEAVDRVVAYLQEKQLIVR